MYYGVFLFGSKYSAHKYGLGFSARQKVIERKEITKIATQKVAHISSGWVFYYSFANSIQTSLYEQMKIQ